MSDINGIGSSGSNALRVTGLASGMDTEAMIKKMMAAENIRLDKMKQDRQYVQWRQDDYRDIIKDFRDLRSSYLLIGSPADTNMIKSVTYTGTVASSDDANCLTATTLPGVTTGSYIVKVNQIATSAKMQGTDLNLSGDVTDITKFEGKTLKFALNGVEKSIILSNPISDKNKNGSVDIDDLVSDINSQIGKGDLSGKLLVTKEGNKMKFNQLNSIDTIKLTDSATVTELDNIKDKVLNSNVSTKLTDLGVPATLSLNVDGTSISFDTTGKTMQDLIDAIGNAKDGTGKALSNNLKVSFSELTHSLSIETKDTGSSKTLSVNGLSSLGVKDGTGTGKDAILEITPPGGSAVSVSKSSNSFTIDNINYKILKDPNGTSYTNTITIKEDAQKSVDKIKAFIEKYNSLVEKISNKLEEKKDYNYKPLTDDQRSSMKDEQIKSWEDKAKKGMLKNDGDLQNILFSMRNSFMSGVKSSGISLSEIGIDTYGSFEAATKPGQLKIDETKLKAAIETHGDQVMKIFIDSPAVPSSCPPEYSSYGDKWQDKYTFDNSGIFKRISNLINDSVVKFDATLLKKAGYKGAASELTNTLTKQLKDQDKSIIDMSKKLATKQEKYYQMFARLEKAMNQMNSQQSWLAQQFGGGQ